MFIIYTLTTSSDRKYTERCTLLTNVNCQRVDSDNVSASGDSLVNTVFIGEENGNYNLSSHQS